MTQEKHPEINLVMNEEIIFTKYRYEEAWRVNYKCKCFFCDKYIPHMENIKIWINENDTAFTHRECLKNEI